VGVHYLLALTGRHYPDLRCIVVLRIIIFSNFK